MKLKYYLRGLGIGVLVTTLILGISFQVRENRKVMTDEEVITRAKELGLVEKTVLSEKDREEPVPEKEKESLPEKEKIPDSGEEETKESLPEETEEPDLEKEEQDPETEEPDLKAEENGEAETVSFQIISGDSSFTVSRKLVEAGLVRDAYSCDSFLCQYGYDKKIQTGTYTMKTDATLAEIAERITGISK